MSTQSASGRGKALRANLRFGLADGMGYSFMVGFGETYFAAFALALAFGEIFAGLLATIPLFAGAVFQLVSPMAVRRLGSRQRWVMVCAALQTASFVPLVLAAWHGSTTRWVLLATAALYWGANFATGPAWTSWMESVVPRRVRSRYFARRTGYTQLAVILATLGGGSLLQYGRDSDLALPAYALIFTLALGSRFFSLSMLGRQTEPEKPGVRAPELRLHETWGRVRERTHGPFLIYLLVIQLAVSISGPFFAPYMLRRLGMPYTEYMTLLAAAYMAKVCVLLLGDRLTARLGARKLLQIGGVGIVPIAALWLVSDSFGYLFFLQVFSGVQWACYELGMFLLVFERIRVEDRTATLTLYNLAHASCSVVGSLLGAGLFTLAGSAYAYAAIFAASSLGRALALPLLARLGPMPRVSWPILIRTLAVRPSAGSIGGVLLLSRRKPGGTRGAEGKDQQPRHPAE